MSLMGPRFYDWLMEKTEEAGLAAWRAELLAPLGGVVCEIGAGNGHNLPHYPQAVEHLYCCEPDASMREALSAAAQQRHRPNQITILDSPAEDLALPSQSCDAVVCTLVLCSVEHLDRALAEIYRVLMPGGQLLFLEHVAAQDNPRRLLLQRALEPIWTPLAGNCHLTRRSVEAIEEAGFSIEHCERASMRKVFPWVRPSARGLASKPIRPKVPPRLEAS